MLDLAQRRHANPDGHNKRKPFKWITVDSFIIAVIAMFAVMPPTLPTINEVYVVIKAFLGAFFFQLAVERGIKKGE